MALDVLLSGKLIRDPTTKTGPSGKPYTTALVRVAVGTKGEESHMVSVIAFQEEGERLGRLRGGDAVSVAGSAKPTVWTKDGEPRPGLDVVATAILTAYDARKRRGDTDTAPNPARRSAGNGGRSERYSGRQAPGQGYGAGDDGIPFDDPIGF